MDSASRCPGDSRDPIEIPPVSLPGMHSLSPLSVAPVLFAGSLLPLDAIAPVLDLSNNLLSNSVIQLLSDIDIEIQVCSVTRKLGIIMTVITNSVNFSIN